MATSSARPSALRTFTKTSHSIDGDTLAGHEQPLRAALDAFRATAGWPDWLSDVPPLDIDYAVLRARLIQLADFVDEVAAGFEAADPDLTRDDVVTADDGLLEPYVTVDPASPVTLLHEGDRWIFSGTDDSDFVKVVTRNGRTYLEVGVVVVAPDGRRRLRWEERELTADQATHLVIRTGGGEDFVGISPDVAVAITVWTGAGNDAVGMPGQNYSSRLGGSGGDVVFTGDGDDRVEGGAGDDRIYGGDGRDYLDGQDGDDTIVGGSDDDIVYGGRGGDGVDGGAGDDYLEGGSDNDALRGGPGRDILSGGRGDDRLHGGAGDDELFGGRGKDAVAGDDGDDKVTYEAGTDTIATVERSVTIELTGDPGTTGIDFGNKPDWMTDGEWNAWRERLDSDIELLRTTQSGRQSLMALDKASASTDIWIIPGDQSDKITIVPYMASSGGDRHVVSFDQYAEALLNHDYLPGEKRAGITGPVDTMTRFDRSYENDDTVSYGQANVADLSYGPPVLTLQHELSHGFDDLHGGVTDGKEGFFDRFIPNNGHFTEILRDAGGKEIRRSDVPRAELNSVGFDTDGNGDPDTVKTNDGTAHPDVFTENALRNELRKPRRDSYTMGTQDQRGPGEHVTYENAT